MKEASYYKKLKNNIVKCELCPNFCVIKNNEVGKCRTRKNLNGKLISLSYGKPIAMHIDPLTKKPIFHMLPGTMTYSIGTAGCQLSCKYCQNWEISQTSPEEIPVPYIEPKEIVKQAIKNKCKSIAYTYTDPVVFYEYMLDIAKLAKKKGLKNIIVCNGYINKEPLTKLCEVIDGANIDLKSMSDKFYKETCGGKLHPVLESLKILKKNKVWLEITYLIIPKLNDNVKEIEKMCKWIKENLGEEVPLHFSRFFPMYKMLDVKPTPEKTLLTARDIALKSGLKYVYIGNVDIENAENTYCPACKKLLIERSGFTVLQNNIKNGKCKCGEKIPGVWS